MNQSRDMSTTPVSIAVVGQSLTTYAVVAALSKLGYACSLIYDPQKLLFAGPSLVLNDVCQTLLRELFGAIAWGLDLFGVSTSSIVAGSAVIGFAVSLGAQNLIKDLVNGILILIEDQYAVGDVIKIGSASGLVEHLNLRVTQIRNGEGSLVTIPNSSIVQVENLTRSWFDSEKKKN